MNEQVPKYRLLLVAQRSDIDALVRLRQALKVLLPRFGVRCVEVVRTTQRGEG